MRVEQSLSFWKTSRMCSRNDPCFSVGFFLMSLLSGGIWCLMSKVMSLTVCLNGFCLYQEFRDDSYDDSTEVSVRTTGRLCNNIFIQAIKACYFWSSTSLNDLICVWIPIQNPDIHLKSPVSVKSHVIWLHLQGFYRRTCNGIQ